MGPSGLREFGLVLHNTGAAGQRTLAELQQHERKNDHRQRRKYVPGDEFEAEVAIEKDPQILSSFYTVAAVSISETHY